MQVEYDKQAVGTKPAEPTERGPLDAVREAFNVAVTQFKQAYPDRVVKLVEVRLIGGKHG